MPLVVADKHSVRAPVRHVLIAALLFLTIATAPLEGYLTHLHPQAAKVAPVVLLGLWGIHLTVSRRAPYFPATSWLLSFLAIWILCSSAINSGNPLVVAEDFRWLPFILVSICLTDLLATVVIPGLAIAGVLLGAVICAVGALLSFIVWGHPRAVGPLPDSNDLAYVLIAALPFALYSPQRVLNRPVTRTGTVLLLVAAAAATLSRGALVAISVGLIWLILRHLVTRRAALHAAFAAILMALLLVTAPPAGLQTALAQKAFIAQSNVESRLIRWEAAARVFASQPLFGAGPGGVQQQYAASSGNAELVEQSPVTHNMYLHVGADLGMGGLLLLWASVVMAFMGARIAEVGPYRRDAVAVQLSLLLIAVASVFLSEQHYMPLWAGISLGAVLRVRSQEHVLNLGTESAR